jgi:CO dehydrogenase maturation factor|tara:strand:+ start:3411 stop:4232 length:822 start_codon:yes stop_codon:yes gene_type:complete
METGFKIAVSGKGGTGKTTIAAMLAHLTAAEGYRVLAVDADPDANLAAGLGMPVEERSRLIPLSERRALIEERTGAKVKEYGQMFKLNPKVSDIAENVSARFRGIDLLVMGAIEGGLSGCACPESVLLRALLNDVVLYKDDCVIVDMEAGLEHLGRGTAQGVDMMLVVVEPGRRAVETAVAVQRMAVEIGVKQVALFGNKVTCPRDETFLEQTFSDDGYLGQLPLSDTIMRADREDQPLIDIADETLMGHFRCLWEDLKLRSGRIHAIEEDIT